ncbi:MAG: sensor histidine kinase [Acidothermaceae bacterium]
MTTTARLVRPRFVAAAPFLAALLGVVSVCCAVAATIMHHELANDGVTGVRLSAADIVLATAFPIVAVIIVIYQPRNIVGWLLLSTAGMGPYLLASQYAAESLEPGRSVTGAAAATWVSIWGFAPYFVVWGLVPLHFPDGALPSPRWRRLRNVTVATITLEIVARMFAPVSSDTSDRLQNPLALPDGNWLNVVTLVSSMLIVLGAGSCGVLAIVVRLRSASGAERARLQWLVLGVTCLVGSAMGGVAVSGTGADAAFGVGMVLLIVCIGVAAIRHQLFDIGTALRRTVLYALLTALLLAAYLAAVAGAGALAPGRRIAYAVVAIVALIAAAARDQLQHAVDRMLFGHRHDPLAVLSRVRARLDMATGPMDALAQLAEALRAALKLPYVAVTSDDPRLALVSAGVDVGAVEDIAAHDHGEQVGSLLVGRRHPDERFDASERAALDEVAQQAGALLASASLLHDLERSRETMVLAREEERRRLRRDLHDGVGPQLAGIAMQLDSLAGSLTGEQAARAERLRDQLRNAVTDVRHVVEDLRPPALDELGLVQAVRQLAEPLGSIVRVDAAEPLPPLHAATEVAGYRILAEAMTNAVRHSQCTACVVAIRAERAWLVLEICDDGTGLAPTATPGVGLQSIRDRASEVGGRLEVADRAGGGTVVRARLPLATT